MAPIPIPIDRQEVHLSEQQRRRLVYLRRAGRTAEAELEKNTYEREALRNRTAGTMACRHVRELREA